MYSPVLRETMIKTLYRLKQTQGRPMTVVVTEEGIKYHLSKMQNQGQIRRTCPDKGGHWEVVAG